MAKMKYPKYNSDRNPKTAKPEDDEEGVVGAVTAETARAIIAIVVNTPIIIGRSGTIAQIADICLSVSSLPLRSRLKFSSCMLKLWRTPESRTWDFLFKTMMFQANC